MVTTSSPEQFHRGFADAFNSGEVQPLLDLYESGASLVPQPDEVVSGHAAIAETLSQSRRRQDDPRHALLHPERRRRAGERRMVHHRHGTRRRPVEVRGTHADLLRRQADGRWLLVIDNPFGATDSAP